MQISSTDLWHAEAPILLLSQNSEQALSASRTEHHNYLFTRKRDATSFPNFTEVRWAFFKPSTVPTAQFPRTGLSCRSISRFLCVFLRKTEPGWLPAVHSFLLVKQNKDPHTDASLGRWGGIHLGNSPPQSSGSS